MSQFDHVVLSWDECPSMAFTGVSKEHLVPNEVKTSVLPRAFILGVKHWITLQVYLKLLLQFLFYPVCHVN
jgi:hypothetical protein